MLLCKYFIDFFLKKNNMDSMKKILLFLLFLYLTFSFQIYADEKVENAYNVLRENDAFEENTLVTIMINFYQKNISPLNGQKCMFYPTCSEFYKKSIKSYGLLCATFMTVDRMFYRESKVSMKYYKYLNDKNAYYDPVYHNFILISKDYYK